MEINIYAIFNLVWGWGWVGLGEGGKSEIYTRARGGPKFWYIHVTKLIVYVTIYFLCT